MTVSRDLIDAQHKHRAYAGLSRHYAEQGDTWLAVHAQFLSDLHAAHAVVLEDGGQVSGVDGAVGDVLEATAVDPSSAHTATRQARDAIARVLPGHVEDMWRARLTPVTHLDALPPASPEHVMATNAAWMEGADADTFLAVCASDRAEALARLASAQAEADPWGEIEARYAADLAAYRGWLVARSVSAGDGTLTLCEMTWTLAVRALEQIGEFPEDPAQARLVVRSRLAWAVAPAERPSLAEALDA